MGAKGLTKMFGVDIDDKRKSKQVEELFTRYHNIIFVDKYESASTNGFHYEVHLKKPVSIQRTFQLRKKFLDDKVRLFFSVGDFLKNWSYDILFTDKKINGEWKKRKFITRIKW